jgi:hypothetical protein
LEKNETTVWFYWAKTQFGWSPDRCSAVFDTFRDYWRAQPGQKALKADWEATWRNWCRRETTTFSKPAKLEKGEVRVRESTPDQSAKALKEAAALKEYFRLGRLPENNRKSQAEIWALVEQQNGSAM